MKRKPRPPAALVRKVVMTCAVAAGVMGLRPFAGPSFGLLAQQPQVQIPKTTRSPFSGPAPAPSPAERISKDTVRVGSILIDTAKKEFSVAGFVNEVQVLEFVANTKGGWKAYESALEMDTNAVNFNVACLLIGLDPSTAVGASRQFDPQAPKGDPVEMFVEWDEGGKPRRVRAEELLYNHVTKQTLPEGPWVYTGSRFVQGNQYQAETEGTLVGFMHTVAPIIENPRPLNGKWGDTGINPALNLKPGMQVRLIVRALPSTSR